MNKKATWLAAVAAVGFVIAVVLVFITLDNTTENNDVLFEALGTKQIEIYQTYQTGESCLNYFDMLVYNSASKADTEEQFKTYFKEYLPNFNEYCNSNFEYNDFTIKYSTLNGQITYTVESPLPITFERENYVY